MNMSVLFKKKNLKIITMLLLKNLNLFMDKIP